MTPKAKQLLIELHTGGNSKTKDKLEQAFPEYFQPFKNGDWIKKIGEDLIIRIKDFEKGLAYGFRKGDWTKATGYWSFNSSPEWWQRVTERQLIEAFIKEFKKRGFKENVKFKSLYTAGAIGNFNGLDFEDFFDEEMIEMDGQMIYSENYVIYKDGVFAQILEEPKTIEQRLEAAFIDVFDKAACIQHWHCRGENDEGMVVSSKHVHELWEVLEKYKSFRDFISDKF